MVIIPVGKWILNSWSDMRLSNLMYINSKEPGCVYAIHLSNNIFLHEVNMVETCDAKTTLITLSINYSRSKAPFRHSILFFLFELQQIEIAGCRFLTRSKIRNAAQSGTVVDDWILYSEHKYINYGLAYHGWTLRLVSPNSNSIILYTYTFQMNPEQSILIISYLHSMPQSKFLYDEIMQAGWLVSVLVHRRQKFAKII